MQNITLDNLKPINTDTNHQNNITLDNLSNTSYFKFKIAQGNSSTNFVANEKTQVIDDNQQEIKKIVNITLDKLNSEDYYKFNVDKINKKEDNNQNIDVSLQVNVLWYKFKQNFEFIFGEIINFLIVFAIVFIFGMLFINFNLFYGIFEEKFFDNKSYAGDITIKKDKSLNFRKILFFSQNQSKNIKPESDKNLINTDEASQGYPENNENTKNNEIKIKYINNNIDQLNNKLSNLKINKNNKIYERDMKNTLEQKIKKYSFDFNLLPPDNRIYISDIGVNVPIVEILYASSEKMEKAQFDDELYKGIVKYPYTPDPYQTGNILLFGHTSYYWWKKNPYGEILAKIPKLENGSVISLIRDNKLYEYEVIDKIVVTPKHVGEEYDKYKNGHYLTLMGCYPIGTDAKRMLIISKLKTNNSNNNSLNTKSQISLNN